MLAKFVGTKIAFTKPEHSGRRPDQGTCRLVWDGGGLRVPGEV